MRTPKVIYGLDDIPPAPKAALLAVQHALTMFGATVSVPLLLGPAMGMTPEQIAILISSVMLCSGVGTILQSTFGTRLPIIQGVSFSFLAAFFAVIAAGGEKNWSPNEMMQYIAGAILVGAFIEMFIGFSGLVGWLRRILSPVVVGPVIMLIGLALFQHGAPKAGAHWPVSGLTIVLIILFSLVLSRKSQFFRIFPIISAVVIVVTLCWIGTKTGIIAPDSPAAVDTSRIGASAWVRANPAEIVFPWGYPKFTLAFIVAALAGYLASIVESFGDYHACSHMAGGGDPTPKQISRGIGFEGVACAITGCLGGFSSTSYSENIGLVGLTRVGSRRVVQIAGVILILLGLFGKFGALAAAIPSPVVGGLYCALFGLIAAIGVQQLSKADLSSDRNLFIAGFSLFMGLSVPAYFNTVASTEGMQVGQTLVTYPPAADAMLASLPEGIRGIVNAIGSTGMAVAAIIGLILDNLIPGSNEERGLDVPSTLVPEAGNVSQD
ncbi:MAG: purine/pyrimidine permease [Phycisphaeraceae bacterium]|nr:purine/pyrimidine permease [Phycisphaeraceae bacterium]